MPGAEILLEPGNITRLLGGLWVTLQIGLISIALSIPLGIIVGMLMTLKNIVVKIIMRIYLDFIRIMPQLVLLYIVFFGLATGTGLNFDGITSSVIVFTLWGAAELGDLVRGSLESIPKSQYESAQVLGFSRFQTFAHVVLPQAVRRLVPPSVNLATRMVKTTSLCMLIGVVEVIRVGQQIIDFYRFQYPTGALWIYGAIFILYFLICFPLSLASRGLEKRFAK
ncbi:MAG: amino acid ABC transporter permease [Coriobacteriales bacterium]|nr:amino acid ABC transporter permease [Coriobacteriales bacterium]